jgi:hypothetical protein
MGLFSCADGETAGANLLGVGLVNLGHDLLKGGGIEALGEDGSPTDNVLACGELFCITAQHFCFDFIPEGFGLGLGLFDEVFKFPEGFDLGSDFDGGHMHSPFCFLRVAPLDGLIITLKTSGVHAHYHQKSVVKDVQNAHLILVVLVNIMVIR